MGSKWNPLMGFLPGLADNKQKPPAIPELPPPVEEVDVSGKLSYMKDVAKRRKGRKSTILSSLGSTNEGKKTVLG